MKRLCLPSIGTACAVAVALALPNLALASDWVGTSADWSSNGNPGWGGTGAPNAAGAVANHGGGGSASTTTLTDDYTVGTISSSNSGWSIRADASPPRTLTLNGNGSTALISNTSTVSGANNYLTFGSSSTASTALVLNLESDLLISYTGANATSVNGAIFFRSDTVISGTGNITLTNNTFNTTDRVNTIFFEKGVNTFTGNVTITKGSVTFQGASQFGAKASNLITLGAATSDNVSLLNLSSGAVNNWQTATGSTGNLVLGGQGDFDITYSGTGTVNSNLTLMSTSTGASKFVTLGGIVSGTGGITTTGIGATRLTQANTYSGNTKVNSATLRLDNNLALQNSAYDTSGTGVITLNAGVTTPTLGGLIGSKALTTAITTNYSAVTSLTLNPNTGKSYTYSGVIANGAAGMTLTKSGTGTQILTGDNSYSGATTITAGTLLIQGAHSGSGLVAVQANGTLGGNGSIAGSLSLLAGADFVFSLTDTLTVNGATVSFGGFGISDLVGLNEFVALGTYTLIDGTATFDFTNVSNFGAGNAASIGGGKSAYFQAGSLQVVVVPEPTTTALLVGGLGMLFLRRRRA